jgi:hypothetical protein
LEFLPALRVPPCIASSSFLVGTVVKSMLIQEVG